MAHHGVRRVLASDLAALESADPHLVKDVEAVHQLRVTTRRVRTLLRLLGDVLPDAAVGELASELRWLARLAGPVRDIDVLVQGIARSPHRAPLVRALQIRRARRADELADGLRSARFGMLLDGFRALLAARRPAESPSLRSAVDAAMRRAVRRLRRAGRAVGKRGRISAVHELRIRAKDLRYLLESFPELYEEAPRRRVLAALREQQRELGKIQDLEVGAAILRDLARPHDVTLADRAAELRGGMKTRRTRARARVAPRLKRFFASTAADLDQLLSG
jgi:CHAD domain-containing protein